MREVQPDLIPDPRPRPGLEGKAEEHLRALVEEGLIDDPIADGALLRWLAGAAEHTFAGHAVAKLAAAILEELEALPAPAAEDDGIADILAAAFAQLQGES
ncbi:MAG: hypothetical protein QM708_13555 [Propioniciclava sp.]|uniref:hypothetical protein n=1 Tax=Propioniciclava sp. TaxID=2038686 RepID=UPI0039E4954F